MQHQKNPAQWWGFFTTNDCGTAMNYSKSIAIQLALRAIAVACLSFFLWRMYNHSVQFGVSLNLVLLAIAEIVTLGIVIFARLAKEAKLDFITATSTAAATFYFLFLSFGGGTELLPMSVAVIIQSLSIIWQIYAKLCLGLSFGLLPANRGIVTTGAYRVVRHPIYFGYFVNHMAFLLSVFSLYNLGIFVAMYAFQAIRIWQEEKVLLNDVAYQEYTKKTKYRFIPYVF